MKMKGIKITLLSALIFSSISASAVESFADEISNLRAETSKMKAEADFYEGKIKLYKMKQESESLEKGLSEMRNALIKKQKELMEKEARLRDLEEKQKQQAAFGGQMGAAQMQMGTNGFNSANVQNSNPVQVGPKDEILDSIYEVKSSYKLESINFVGSLIFGENRSSKVMLVFKDGADTYKVKFKLYPGKEYKFGDANYKVSKIEKDMVEIVSAKGKKIIGYK